MMENSSPETFSLFEAEWLADNERIAYWDGDAQRVLVWNWRTDEVSTLDGVARTDGDLMVAPDGRTLYVLEQKVDGEIWMLTLDRGGTAD